MRASTSPLGAELARWAARSHPGFRNSLRAVFFTRAYCRTRYSYMHPQMRGDWGAPCACAGSLLPALTPERGCMGPSGNNIEYAKANKRRRNRPNPSPTATWTHTTHTDTDRHTHTRTDATRPFRGIQSRIHQFRQCCTACKRGQLVQAEAAWHGAHFLYQAVSSPAALL